MFYLFAQVERNHAVVLGVEDQHRTGDVVHTERHTVTLMLSYSMCEEQTAVHPDVH